jgi:uroporphyrinogen-III synthase
MIPITGSSWRWRCAAGASSTYKGEEVVSSSQPLRGRRIAVTAERRGTEQAALVTALGGEPLVCPTACVAWEDDAGAPQRWLEALTAGVDDVVFMTGMGADRLLTQVEALGRLPDALTALGQARVVVRGAKPQPVLRRRGVRIDVVPRPATSTGVLHALGTDLRGRIALVQGAAPEPTELTAGLRAAGAEVHAVCLYRYRGDAVVGAADPLLDALVAGEVDVVTFTSAAAVEGLVAAATARAQWPQVRRRLNSVVVAAVGPVTAATLTRHAVAVHVQPAEPRLGPMMRELAAALAAR